MDLTAAPPTLMRIDAYLLSLSGKAGRSRVADRLAAIGLRMWHMSVLAALADFGPHAQRDLSTRLSIDPSDVAKVIDQLAGLGHIGRARDAADRRRVQVTITASGRQLLTQLLKETATIDDALLSELTPAEREQLHGLLLKVFAVARPRA